MIEEDLVAPCGMNCSLCISYQFGKNDLNKKGFHRTYCPGCIPRGKNCTYMKSTCDKLGKGKVRFCFECDDFPCKRLKILDKRYRTKYHMSMIENLNYIKENGLEAFLREEELKWRCSQCGGTVCCHNGLCLNCNINTLIRNKKYRWNEEKTK
ncbi:DUF3795 domain-containing protein [Gudongella sp. SC589]|jgi:hypothetical protein|uniref:DUF3795 domain-containing protein n=1 Tax=Gudongella sp. SC589 TaxID=3385990 RepID=UPI003904D426